MRGHHIEELPEEWQRSDPEEEEGDKVHGAQDTGSLNGVVATGQAV